MPLFLSKLETMNRSSSQNPDNLHLNISSLPIFPILFSHGNCKMSRVWREIPQQDGTCLISVRLRSYSFSKATDMCIRPLS